MTFDKKQNPPGERLSFFNRRKRLDDCFVTYKARCIKQLASVRSYVVFIWTEMRMNDLNGEVTA